MFAARFAIARPARAPVIFPSFDMLIESIVPGVLAVLSSGLLQKTVCAKPTVAPVKISCIGVSILLLTMMSMAIEDSIPIAMPAALTTGLFFKEISWFCDSDISKDGLKKVLMRNDLLLLLKTLP
jgi:hypothetical protein